MLRVGFSRLAFLRVGPVAIVAALCLTWTVPSSAGYNDNLLLNPDLREGTDGTPDYWRPGAYLQCNSELTWNLDQWPGQLEISNAQPNDAGWGYSFHLDPGWYHFTASIKTKNVPDTANTAGAALCVMESAPGNFDRRGTAGFGNPPSPCSRQVSGTTDWQAVGIYVKAGESGADGALECRLGGYSATNTGEAVCKDFSAVEVDGPSPDDSDPVLDMDVQSDLTPAQP